MFPIIDIRGNVIAFGGRVMDDEQAQIPQLLGYAGLQQEPQPVRHELCQKDQSGPAYLLAEGYMDVIALHQAGFDCAVASLGTALTEEQARLHGRRYAKTRW